MKKLPTTLLALMLAFICVAQPTSITFNDIQSQFGTDNVSEEKVDDYIIQTKKLSGNELITFVFNNNVVETIDVEKKSKGKISSKRFAKIVDKVFPEFNVTNYRKSNVKEVFYDKFKKLLVTKVFESSSDDDIKKIVFVPDAKIVKDIVANVQHWKNRDGYASNDDYEFED